MAFECAVGAIVWTSGAHFKESVENTLKDHRYATTKLEDVLKAKGVDWAYEPISNSNYCSRRLDALGPVKK